MRQPLWKSTVLVRHMKTYNSMALNHQEKGPASVPNNPYIEIKPAKGIEVSPR